MEKFLLEGANLKNVVVPIDLNAGANAGARVALAEGQRCAFLVLLGASSGATVTFTVQQHDAATSGTSKALAIGNPYFHKNADATVFTKVVPVAATDAYDLGTIFTSKAGVAVFEVLTEDLDVTNGFAWVSLSMADAAAAKPGAIVALVSPGRKQPVYGQEI